MSTSVSTRRSRLRSDQLRLFVSELIAAPTELRAVVRLPRRSTRSASRTVHVCPPAQGATRLRFCCPAAFVVVRCAYASAQILPPMYAIAQNLLRRRVMLKTMKLRAKARAKTIVQNVSVRTDEGSVDCTDGFSGSDQRGEENEQIRKRC